MDISQRKLLLEEYKNRKPEMGVISFRCIETGEDFIAASKDTKADFNSTRFKLETSTHPNKRLLSLWNQYGENGFELSVLKVLKYEDPQANHNKELEELCEQCLENDKNATRIWR